MEVSPGLIDLHDNVVTYKSCMHPSICLNEWIHQGVEGRVHADRGGVWIGSGGAVHRRPHREAATGALAQRLGEQEEAGVHPGGGDARSGGGRGRPLRRQVLPPEGGSHPRLGRRPIRHLRPFLHV